MSMFVHQSQTYSLTNVFFCFFISSKIKVCHALGQSVTGIALFMFLIIPQGSRKKKFLWPLSSRGGGEGLNVVFVNLTKFLCHNANFLIIFLFARFSVCTYICLSDF